MSRLDEIEARLRDDVANGLPPTKDSDLRWAVALLRQCEIVVAYDVEHYPECACGECVACDSRAILREIDADERAASERAASERLDEALRWYADNEHWQGPTGDEMIEDGCVYHVPAHEDNGERARVALRAAAAPGTGLTRFQERAGAETKGEG